MQQFCLQKLTPIRNGNEKLKNNKQAAVQHEGGKAPKKIQKKTTIKKTEMKNNRLQCSMREARHSKNLKKITTIKKIKSKRKKLTNRRQCTMREARHQKNIKITTMKKFNKQAAVQQINTNSKQK